MKIKLLLILFLFPNIIFADSAITFIVFHEKIPSAVLFFLFILFLIIEASYYRICFKINNIKKYIKISFYANLGSFSITYFSYLFLIFFFNFDAKIILHNLVLLSYILTIFIEFSIIKFFLKEISIKKLLSKVCIANIISYSIIASLLQPIIIIDKQIEMNKKKHVQLGKKAQINTDKREREKGGIFLRHRLQNDFTCK